MTSRRRMLAGDNLTSKGVVNGVIQDDWETICKIAKAGRASSFYSVGNKKDLTWGEFGTAQMMLAAIDTDDRSDGKGKANMTWIPYRMAQMQVYDSSSNASDLMGMIDLAKPAIKAGVNGYDIPSIGIVCEGMIYKLPHCLQEGILQVKKLCDAIESNGLVEGNYRLWLFRAKEIGITTSGDTSTLTYKSPKPHNCPYHYGSYTGANFGYLIRNTSGSTTYSSLSQGIVNKYGSISSSGANETYYFTPCFCL